jgi:hypothetical protein
MPVSGHPLLLLQPVQRRIERAGIHSQPLAGVQADGLADALAMLRAPEKRLQNQQIERALQQLNAVLITVLRDVDCLLAPSARKSLLVYL